MTVKVQVKKYVMDETLSWEERYRKLEAHHLEETQWLIKEIERLQEGSSSSGKMPASQAGDLGSTPSGSKG